MSGLGKDTWVGSRGGEVHRQVEEQRGGRYAPGFGQPWAEFPLGTDKEGKFSLLLLHPCLQCGGGDFQPRVQCVDQAHSIVYLGSEVGQPTHCHPQAAS